MVLFMCKMDLATWGLLSVLQGQENTCETRLATGYSHSMTRVKTVYLVWSLDSRLADWLGREKLNPKNLARKYNIGYKYDNNICYKC